MNEPRTMLGQGCARHAVAWAISAVLHAAVFLLAGAMLMESARFGMQTGPSQTASAEFLGAEVDLAAWIEPAPAPVAVAPPPPPPATQAALEPPPARKAEPILEAQRVPHLPPPAPMEQPIPPTSSPPLPAPARPAPRTTTAAVSPVRTTATSNVSSSTVPSLIASVAAPELALPDYERNPPPAYPRSARSQGLQGLVLLEVRVTDLGSVDSLRVKQSSGHAILDQAALKAVHGWRFRPARAAGLPIASSVEVPIRFRLD